MSASTNKQPRARRLLAALLAAAALGLLALPALAWAGPSRFDTGFQDPLDSAFQDPDTSHSYSVARAQHARFIRIPVAWSVIASRKPRHPTNFRDPAYYWSALDSHIRGVRKRGMQPILSLYATPGWAQYGNGLTPRTGYFKSFVTAVAKRYNGKGGRPRIRYVQIWNEANIFVYFGRSKMGAHYRDLVNAAYKPVHAAAKGNKLIAGGFGPIGGNISISPLRMMRDALCVSKSGRATCKKKMSFDIWSQQPYTSGGPNHRSSKADDVQIGDLAKVRRVLRQARKVRHIRRTPRFWITEFSWDTRPPDPGGVPLQRHARWTAEAFYRMWAHGVSTVIWFQLRDAPEGQGWGYTWQGGLFPRTTSRYSDEHAKPVARVVRFPFAAVPSGSRVTLWGRTPDGRRHKVVVQRQSGKTWRTVAKVRSSSHGVFSTRRRGLRGKLLRAKVGGSTSMPFRAVHTRDRRVRPFGGPLNP